MALLHHTRGFTHEGLYSLREVSNMTHTHMCGACPRPHKRLP